MMKKILVVLTNYMTAAQEKLTMKSFEVRSPKPRELLKFYISNHTPYKRKNNFTAKLDILKKISSCYSKEAKDFVFWHKIENPNASYGMDGDQDNVGRPPLFYEVT